MPKSPRQSKKPVKYPPHRAEEINPLEGIGMEGPDAELKPYFEDKAHHIWLYQNNCLEVMDAIAAKHPEGRFDMIFADPPYFLSNGGITCHAGKMVSVHKGDWDKSQGPEENHNFNREWLRRCQRVLKPNGTLWVTGTQHVIFSVGFAMQQLGFKILNDIAWEKPNPPPNLSCRYFTHSTETVLWAAKTEKSKHVFNYQEMRKVTGKQMKTVWRGVGHEAPGVRSETPSPEPQAPGLDSVWTMTAPGREEKTFGKHPTQKPVALVERCIIASTHPGDLVLDPFMGGGTTAVACVRMGRLFVGVELDLTHIALATKRADREVVLIWLRDFRVRMVVTVAGRAGSPLPAAALDSNARRAAECAPYQQQKNLDLFSNLIDRSAAMADKPEPATERIFHETKFVFLSCAQVSSASVVHTTVDISLQEAWTNAPSGKRRETTHIVRCETEILRVKSG